MVHMEFKILNTSINQQLKWYHGVVIIITAQLHSTKP